MVQRPLMTTDELKTMAKGSFVVLKTGMHPYIAKLKLFFRWGIKFDQDNPFALEERSTRKVSYASREHIEGRITRKFMGHRPLPLPEYEEPPLPNMDDLIDPETPQTKKTKPTLKV